MPIHIHSKDRLIRRKSDGLVCKVVAWNQRPSGRLNTVNPGIMVAPVRSIGFGLVVEWGERIGPLDALEDSDWEPAGPIQVSF